MIYIKNSQHMQNTILEETLWDREHEYAIYKVKNEIFFSGLSV